jgi:hypothetical protein
MTAIASALAHTAGIHVEADSLRAVAIFCGVGLAISLCCASYGLDLSLGFF